jgi:hypothetical protein
MAAVAALPANITSIPKTPPPGSTRETVWALCRKLATKLKAQEDDKPKTLTDRTTDVMVEGGTAVGTAVLVGMAESALPEFASFQVGQMRIDTKLILGVLALIGGGAMVVAKYKGGNLVFEAGKTITAISAYQFTQRIASSWFKAAA